MSLLILWWSTGPSPQLSLSSGFRKWKPLHSAPNPVLWFYTSSVSLSWLVVFSSRLYTIQYNCSLSYSFSHISLTPDMLHLLVHSLLPVSYLCSTPGQVFATAYLPWARHYLMFCLPGITVSLPLWQPVIWLQNPILASICFHAPLLVSTLPGWAPQEAEI